MKRSHNNFFLHDVLKKCSINFEKKKIKNILVKNIKDILNAKKNDITLLNNINYVKDIEECKASVVIVSKSFEKYVPKKIISIVSDNVDLDYIKILNFFNPDSYYSKINYISLNSRQIIKKFKNLKFGKNFYIEKNVAIGNDVLIGNNVTIKNNTFIGNNVTIGSNVSIECAEILNNVHICDGAIIGKKGFGFKFVNNQCFRIPHIGKVIIKEGCEIGSYCVIDRGSLTDTIIGENTFLDNFVHIAHNVVIGNNCILAAQTGVAGSSKIGNNVIIGGQVGISGHLIIGNNVKIGGKSGVVKNIKDNEVVMGYPATSFRQFVKNNKVL